MALVTGGVAGTVHNLDDLFFGQELIVTVLGFVVFETLRSIFQTMFLERRRAYQGKGGQRWTTSFVYYWRAQAGPLLRSGTVIYIVGALCAYKWGSSWDMDLELLMTISFIFSIPISLLFRGLQLSIFDRRIGEGLSTRFWASGSSQQAILMLRVLFSTVVLLVVSVIWSRIFG